MDLTAHASEGLVEDPVIGRENEVLGIIKILLSPKKKKKKTSILPGQIRVGKSAIINIDLY